MISSKTNKNFGLTEDQLNQLINKLSEIKEIDRVLIFGSRAMGNNKERSDIDLAILGENINLETELKVMHKYSEETNIPFLLDVVNYNTLNNKDLKEHIDEYGKVLYEAD